MVELSIKLIEVANEMPMGNPKIIKQIESQVP